MRRLALLGIVCLAWLSSPSLAVTNCEESTVQGMLRCAEIEIKKQDRKISFTLSRAAKLLDSEPRTAGSIAADRLKQSQDEWEKYRSSFCSALGISTSGPNEWSYLHAAGCSIELGSLRLKELSDLEKLLQNYH